MIADLTVLTTRLPYVDRSTLSQAWYDALHLQRQVPRNTAQGPLRLQVAPGDRGNPSAVVVDAHARRIPPSAKPTARVVERRTMLASQAKIHAPLRTVLRCLKQPAAVDSQALQLRNNTAIVRLPDGERICLLISGGTHGLRLVAICSPALRPRVVHALAHIRTLFAERGVACNMQVGGFIHD